jgi:hypothetical protein
MNYGVQMLGEKTTRISIAKLAVVLSIILCFSSVCGKKASIGGSVVQTKTQVVWEYPVHLGDSRAKVHKLLGGPDNPTLGYRESYPASGVELWFSDDDLVTKMSFIGEAAEIWRVWAIQIPSYRNLMLGLTAFTNEEGFKRILGPPLQDYGGHCIWKTNDLLIDAGFLESDSTENGKTFMKGGLIYLDVTPAL